MMTSRLVWICGLNMEKDVEKALSNHSVEAFEEALWFHLLDSFRSVYSAETEFIFRREDRRKTERIFLSSSLPGTTW
ncbi:hypothetical protein RYX36_033570 [Vicia faba]